MGSEDLAGIEAVLRDLRIKYIATASELQGIKYKCIEETIALAMRIPGVEDAQIRETTETVGGIVIENAQVVVTGTPEAQNAVGERSPEIRQKYLPLMSAVAARMNNVERNIGVYLGKLGKFTVLNPLYEKSTEAHAHIVIVHKGRLQEGQISFSPQAEKFDKSQYDISMLEQVKERSLRSKCNVYIATHPSEPATPQCIFHGAKQQVIGRIAKKYLPETQVHIEKYCSLN